MPPLARALFQAGSKRSCCLHTKAGRCRPNASLCVKPEELVIHAEKIEVSHPDFDLLNAQLNITSGCAVNYTPNRRRTLAHSRADGTLLRFRERVLPASALYG